MSGDDLGSLGTLGLFAAHRRAARLLRELPRPLSLEGLEDDHREAAAVWIDDNPRGWVLFERFALEAAGTGSPFGIGLIAERVRWETFLASRDRDGFKINNNHRAYLARALVAIHPELDGLLRFRRTRC